MIKQSQWLLMLLLLCLMSACQDDAYEVSRPNVVDENGMVTLTLNTNVPALKLTRSVDVNGEEINTLWVLAFNEEGYMISRVLAEHTQESVTELNIGLQRKGTLTVKVPSTTRILHFLANVNMDNFSDQANIGRHENEVVAPLLSSSGNLVYWGRRTFDSAEALEGFATASGTDPVILYRNQALVQYEVAHADQLKVIGWTVCNQHAYGTVAPFNPTADDPFAFNLGTNDFVTTLPESYRIKQRDDDGVSTATSVSGDPRYIFENINAEDDQVYLIMGISKVNNTSGEFDPPKYYKVMLVNDQKEPYQIIRNHRYIVKISNVNEAYGVETFEAVKNATPANNPWITISDEIPEVSNGSTTLSIEGETTVLYQAAGDYKIEFYYNGTTQPDVKWQSNEGVAADISASDVVWDSTTKKGTITLHVNAPAQGVITSGTLQIKEKDGFLARRVKVLTSEPFEFTPVWIGSEIPLLDGENITILFNIPDNFPDELLPIDVKFGCDLVDGQIGQELKVIMEETSYSVPVYTETSGWGYGNVTKDWNYKYVYSATEKGQHWVNFRTELTDLSGTALRDYEFHIYMEGDDSRNGNDLFRHRDLFFAFQDENSNYRILLEGEATSTTAFSTREITDLDPVYGEEISIPFTLGKLATSTTGVNTWSDVTADSSVPSGTQVWVYYDPTLLTPSGNWSTLGGTDYFGNYYCIYNTDTAENTITFTTIVPNFDCYIVLAAKSISNYGEYTGSTTNHNLGVNERGYRSASVTVRSTGRLEFNPQFSIDGTNFTTVSAGEKFNVPYGTGQYVWLKIDVPSAAQSRQFQFRLGTQYLEPVEDIDKWAAWTVSEGDGWTYEFAANETTDNSKTFKFKTTHLASEETLTLASGPYVGFTAMTVDIVNPGLTGTIQLPEGVGFESSSPYVILERATDGTRIGTFNLGGENLMNQNSAAYSLALRGEYNLKETDRINVKWSPVNVPDIYIWSGELSDVMKNGITIELAKQE